MVKSNQFSATVQYVTPSCKAVEFRTRQTILAGSYGNPGQAGSSGDVDIDEEDY